MLQAPLCYQWSHGPWLSRYPYPPPISSRVPSWRHLLQIMITRTYLSLSTVVPATKCGHTPQWSHPRTDGTRFSCIEIQLTSLNAKVGLCIYNSVCIISISITARIYFSLYPTLRSMISIYFIYYNTHYWHYDHRFNALQYKKLKSCPKGNAEIKSIISTSPPPPPSLLPLASSGTGASPYATSEHVRPPAESGTTHCLITRPPSVLQLLSSLQ